MNLVICLICDCPMPEEESRDGKLVPVCETCKEAYPDIYSNQPSVGRRPV